MNGQLCPQIEHALQTGAGQAIMTACNRSGAWKYAGMGGACVGLDLDHVLKRAARFAPGADIYDLDHLASRLEAGALKGMAKTESKSAGDKSTRPEIDLDAIIDGMKSQ